MCFLLDLLVEPPKKHSKYKVNRPTSRRTHQSSYTSARSSRSSELPRDRHQYGSEGSRSYIGSGRLDVGSSHDRIEVGLVSISSAILVDSQFVSCHWWFNSSHLPLHGLMLLIVATL